jgi:dimethylargininase
MIVKEAIVRIPGKSVINGLSQAGLGKPDYEILLQQHQKYCKTLEYCGINLIRLPPIEEFPDSCFVEDTAVVNKKLAVITRPGAPSRRGEAKHIAPIIREQFNLVKMIIPPGNLDGGDILQIGNKYFVGLSKRTNLEGATQFQKFQEEVGFDVSMIALQNFLHLKSGINVLDSKTVLTAGQFIKSSAFNEYDKITVPKSESYAANCLNLNGTVIIPAGFPQLLQKIRDRGYITKEIQMSEFQKLDGGLSCLSIRF